MGGLLRATFWITDWNVHAVLIPHTLFYKKNSLFNYILKQTVDGFGGTFFNDLSDKNSLSFKTGLTKFLFHTTEGTGRLSWWRIWMIGSCRNNYLYQEVLSVLLWVLLKYIFSKWSSLICSIHLTCLLWLLPPLSPVPIFVAVLMDYPKLVYR